MSTRPNRLHLNVVQFTFADRPKFGTFLPNLMQKRNLLWQENVVRNNES